MQYTLLYPNSRKNRDYLRSSLCLNSARSSSLTLKGSRKSSLNKLSSLDLQSFRPPSKKLINDASTLYEVTEESNSVTGMNPRQVIEKHKERLTDLELKEVLNYTEIFYLGNSVKKHNGVYDDEKGYYKTFVGDHIAYRYEILHILGEGSFGIVINCFDHKNQTPVAIKILRQGPEFDSNGYLEIKNLDIISSKGSHDNIVEQLSNFKFRDHLCIVFELLSLDLFQFIKQRHFQGLALNVLKRITVQLLIGLKQIHEKGLIHCDLKPENILFKLTHKSSIKIIDFGSACLKSNKSFTYIQSRYYRAPEVILELEYNEKIDIWSLGCILFELYTGYPLFAGNDEIEQLCRIIETIGEIPQSMARNSPRTELFDDMNRLILANQLGVLPGNSRLSSQLLDVDSAFLEFLNECLKFEPSKRISAENALKHRWIKGGSKNKNKCCRMLYKSLNIS